MPESRPWEWGPSGGYGIIRDADTYHLIKIPQGVSEDELIGGYPRGMRIQSVMNSKDLDDLARRAMQDYAHWPDDMHYQDMGGLNREERQLAQKYDLSKSDVGVLGFCRAVTGRWPENVSDPMENLEDLVADTYFQKAVKEVAQSEIGFIKTWLTDAPLKVKQQAIWRTLVLNQPVSGGKFGLNRRDALLVQMYLAANPSIAAPRQVHKIDREQLVNNLVSDPQKFMMVVLRLVKKVGLPAAVTIMLNDLGRLQLLRGYVRKNWRNYVGLA